MEHVDHLIELRVEINPYTNEPAPEIIKFLTNIPSDTYVIEWKERYLGMGNVDIWLVVHFAYEEDALAFKMKFECCV